MFDPGLNTWQALKPQKKTEGQALRKSRGCTGRLGEALG